MLGADVKYCRFNQSPGSMTVSSVSPGVAPDSQHLRGFFDMPASLVINEAFGGCDGLYGPNDCPTIVGDINLSGSFELINAPMP